MSTTTTDISTNISTNISTMDVNMLNEYVENFNSKYPMFIVSYEREIATTIAYVMYQNKFGYVDRELFEYCFWRVLLFHEKPIDSSMDYWTALLKKNEPITNKNIIKLIDREIFKQVYLEKTLNEYQRSILRINTIPRIFASIIPAIIKWHSMINDDKNITYDEIYTFAVSFGNECSTEQLFLIKVMEAINERDVVKEIQQNILSRIGKLSTYDLYNLLQEKMNEIEKIRPDLEIKPNMETVVVRKVRKISH